MDITSTNDIIKVLSEKSGIPTFYDIEFTDLNKARNEIGNPCLIRVFDEKGTEHPYMDRGMRFDNQHHRKIKASKFIVRKYRGIYDFGFEVKFVKKTKICEGGGWYSMGGIYKVENMYFES